MAAVYLRICVAVLLRLDLESPATFALGLGFTLVGAAILRERGANERRVA